jgi:hypothetical protein
MKVKYSTLNVGVVGRAPVLGCSLFLFFTLCLTTFGSTNEPAVPEDSTPPSVTGQNARELYNAGIKKLRAGKLNDAESLLEASLVRQDERVQSRALYDLGHVRFVQGLEELKKSPPGATQRSRTAAQAGEEAIHKATDALAGNDLQQMVEAYLAGHGARKDMRAAMTSIRRAMEAYGKTLTKWRRSLGDFQSAAEMNPADTNAVHNAEVVQQAIARLVDSLREMQMAAGALAGKQSQLNGLMKQLRGQIPAPNMPPGAQGEEGEEGDGGKRPMPESLSGLEEKENSGGGDEMEMQLSPENAGALLNSLQPGGKPLPVGQDAAGKPKDRSGRIW